MSEPIRALFMGSGLVLTAVSSTWTSTTYDQPPIGVPAAEAWCDESWFPVRELMREVMRTGVPMTTVVPATIVTISPYWRDGRIAGVVTRHQPVPPTPGHPLTWTVPAVVRS